MTDGAVAQGPVRRLVDPQAVAVAAQVLMVLRLVAVLVVAVTGGPRSAVFPLLALAVGPLVIADVVVSARWFWRCRSNGEVLAPGAHKYSVGGALAAWLFAVPGFWVLRRALSDLWRSSGAPAGEWLVNAFTVCLLVRLVGILVESASGAGALGYSAFDLVALSVQTGLDLVLVRALTARQRAMTPPLPTAEPLGATA
ncbi:DUF4328 domain-containing protein [Kitasatospora sp. NPDC002227]|uniref:DUF4328 domain-containing protein n=1 Tax=Kitasatospora sp. NPDC002227 TaxID=3154773 RepID=UPI00332BB5C1